MKDYWREESKQTRPEANIYRLLEEKKVEHVAKMEAGGDVVGLVTRTQESCFLPHSRALPDGRSYHHLKRPLQCHRIFLRTVARDLTTFVSCKTLVLCIADAMKAAQQAFDRVHILHRDISVGNIMIAKDRGILIDWDLCLVLDSNEITHRPGRMGTWQFVSVHLLMGRRGAGDDAGKQTVTHSVINDRESAFWVLFYVALRYLRQNLSETELYEVPDSCFDASGINYRDVGKSPLGLPKLAILKELAQSRSVIFHIQEMNDLLHELANSLVYRYVDAEDISEEQRSAYEGLLQMFGPDSGPVKVNPYYKYVTAKNNMEGSTTWFHETLREYADRIPSNTSDEHLNLCYPKDLSYATKRKIEAMDSNMSLGRVDGMGGNLIRSSQRFVSQLDEEEEVVHNAKRKKSKK
ncbi:hypothetical protein CPB85DRAFT_1314522 [Mucidula mucida]|nr:hypothetical protein CPB85DRAFT_1314522 [Mucidula mucida]